jgi:hypothetical protein
MPLREDQIQRYSRQILLREVGGKGQERLLAASLRVEGAGPAIDVALAYLAISGSSVVTQQGPHAGFLFGTPLETVSPDALGSDGDVRGWLGPIALAERVAPSLFRVGISNERVVGVPAGAPWVGQGGGSIEAPPVALGAFAALLAQRYALGVEDEARSVTFSGARWVVG